MTTPILGLDELAAAQAQPELIVNAALRILEAVTQLRVIDQDLSTPPATPADGDRYIIAYPGAAEWEGHEDKIALFMGTEWVIIQPQSGWLAYVIDEGIYVKYDSDNSPPGWIAFP